ncbi:unnamed protein product [Dibothriocephalus latus]|uniref:Major facilitator superfamily (MFS) profile domain-containing protein n=1 Tax=Dibothriocephalus latus TaxID=60516 RepID=A0A3P6UBX2_DIBLA|nr:unnamed protein product [Dibothriocephalus latus]
MEDSTQGGRGRRQESGDMQEPEWNQSVDDGSSCVSETGRRRKNVDDLLTEVIKPFGWWQFIVTMVAVWSDIPAAIFPVYGNSVPRFRCAADPPVEALLLRNSSSFNVPIYVFAPKGPATMIGNQYAYDFDTIAASIGPWSQNITESDLEGTGEQMYGCYRYKRNWSRISNASQLIAAPALPPTTELETCKAGYVYEVDEFQYPSGIVIEWDLVCEKEWLAPLSTSLYMLGMVPGFWIGGWCADAIVYYLPESPRWLLGQERTKEAALVLYKGYLQNRRGLKCWRKPQDKTLTLEEFEHFLQEPCQKAEEQSVDSSQTACLFGILLYARIIRSYVYLVAFINNLTGIPGAILSSILYARIRHRRRPLMTVYACACLSLAIGGIHAWVFPVSNDIVLTVCSNLGLVLSTAITNMLLTYIPELYPSCIRSQGLGNAAGLGRIGAAFGTFINQLDISVAHGAPLVFYAGLLLLALVALIFLPDTTGENLPDKMDSSQELDLPKDGFVDVGISVRLSETGRAERNLACKSPLDVPEPGNDHQRMVSLKGEENSGRCAGRLCDTLLTVPEDNSLLIAIFAERGLQQLQECICALLSPPIPGVKFVLDSGEKL